MCCCFRTCALNNGMSATSDHGAARRRRDRSARATQYAILLLLALLGGCVSSQDRPAARSQEATAEEPAPVELNLSLPPSEPCACPPPSALEPVDHTFLERGLGALAAGEYVEAVRHFQRFQRMEQTALADFEAELAIAYISVLPGSPVYDPEAARASWQTLQREPPALEAMHPQVAVLQETLQAVMALLAQLSELQQSNDSLREDLEKREQALKRLRDLTLGQQPAARP